MTIKFSDITGGGIPYGNTAGRPANPGTGKLYSNGETQRIELYTQNGTWENIVQEVPGVSSISGNYSEATNSGVITIYGTNFVSGATAAAIGSNGVVVNATSTVYNSLVQLTATFTNLSNAYEPYDIRVTNPSQLFGLMPDALYINASPVWVTPAGSLGTFDEQVSISLSATTTDSDSSSITYALANGSSLPSGITLSSNGLISGTLPDITSTTTYTFTVNATDGLNTIPRTFSITSSVLIPIEFLIVGGGGGGGSQVGGGGGAGGMVTGTRSITRLTPQTITVGAGGVGCYPFTDNNVRVGSAGSSSIAHGITAFGGGGGGGHGSGLERNAPFSGQPTQNGRNGGSGGGAGANDSGANYGSATQVSGSGYTGYGNRGGTATQGGWSGGGGGGAGGVGGNSPGGTTGGTGGPGLTSSITGTSSHYAAGGGGCWQGSSGSTTRASGIGGIGVGDTSTYAADSVAKAGVPGTGSGGGGSRDNISGSGDGGSGVVVVAYPDTYPAIQNIDPALTYDTPTRAGYRVYRFTAGSGSVTF